MKQINDPVFGELEYSEQKKCWKREITLDLWGDNESKLEIVVKCDENEEITDVQREAYKSYLKNLPKISKEVPVVLLSYYKEHYEDFNRNLPLPDELKIESVNKNTTLNYIGIKQLFFDRKGNYGWLSDFISELYLITIILSDDEPVIFRNWSVLKSDYVLVDDEEFGKMYFDIGWKKEIKTNINGIDGEWVLLQAAASKGKDINPGQRSCHQKYQKNEQVFLKEYPKALLEYYLENYELIEEVWEDAALFDKEHINEDKIKSLIQFQKLYFNRDGIRYGWLCKCAWDSYYGLSLYYDGEYDGICVGIKDDLFM